MHRVIEADIDKLTCIVDYMLHATYYILYMYIPDTRYTIHVMYEIYTAAMLC